MEFNNDLNSFNKDLQQRLQQAIAGGDFQQVGNLVFACAGNGAFENQMVVNVNDGNGDDGNGDKDEEIARLRRELAQERAERAREREASAKREADLRQRVENIDWYEWLGKWVGRVGHLLADITCLDGVCRLFRNKLFLQSLTTTILEVFGTTTLVIGGSVVGSVVVAAIGYWIYKTEGKQKKNSKPKWFC